MQTNPTLHLQLKFYPRQWQLQVHRGLCFLIKMQGFTEALCPGLLASQLVPPIFDYVLDSFKSPDKAQQRSALFQIMGQLIKALQACASPVAVQTLSDYREEVLSLSASGLVNPAVQEQALFCLAQLAEFPNCLSHAELVFAIQSITDLLVKPASDANDDLAANALDALKSLAQLYPSDIEELTLPPLMQLLPDTAPRKMDTERIAEYRVALACLAGLCVFPSLFEAFLIRILNRVERITKPSDEDSEAVQQSILYAHHLLTTLRVIIEKKAKLGHTDLRNCASRVIHRIIGLLINRSLEPANQPAAGISPKVIGDAGKIVTLLVQQMEERYASYVLNAFGLAHLSLFRSQRSTWAELQAPFFDGKIQSLCSDAATPQVSFRPFTVCNCLLLLLFERLLILLLDLA